jgi:FkbM family methyltransferase
MRKKIARWVPGRVLDSIRRRREEKREKAFFNQELKMVRCGAYELAVPASHLLLTLQENQPLRDVCVGIAAKFLGQKYPNSTMIDVGANVGDTAAIIASYATNKLILVEGSDYYHSLLIRNVNQLPNEVVIKKTLIADGTPIEGLLTHWGGTAFLNRSSERKSIQNTERLCDIADDDSSFIKLDTDGNDFAILLDSMDWLAKATPGILFENQIQNENDSYHSQELLNRLKGCGYKFFILWDDAGFHLLSTTCISVMADMTRYLLNIHKNGKYISIYNTDVLCLHEKDEDIYTQVSEHYQTA